MRVLITGAGGLVGSALVRLYRHRDVIALRHRDLDITRPDDSYRIVAELQPHIVFNCAVIGVDDCELDRDRAHLVNASGPAALADACRRSGAQFVHFSTNYIFDGERDPGRPYRRDDPARPVNVYGQTKLLGEQLIDQVYGASLVVRTSWVFGSGKQSFLATAAQKLARGERIQAITDTWASTTYVEDLVGAVAGLVADDVSGVHQVVNEGVCTYESFALECARLTGADPSLIDRVTEAEMKRAAKRPRVTPMVPTVPMRPWQEALAEYVRLIP